MFIKYPKFRNSYDQATVGHILRHPSSNQDWVAEEKIHGANLQMYVDEAEVSFYSRGTNLQHGSNMDSFYNLKEYSEDFSENASGLFEYTRAQINTPITAVTLYGEYYGGSYPGHKCDASNSTVQKGVFYSPCNHFILFDIVLWVNDERVPVNVANRDWVAEQTGFDVPPRIARGAFQDVICTVNDGQSLIPQLHGLPPIEDNIMEGVVIRPLAPFDLPNGKPAMLKSKNAKFAEKTSSKKARMAPKNVSNELQASMNSIDAYLNENRLAAVSSKVGGIVDENIGKLLSGLVNDALEDYNIDNPTEFQALSKQDMKDLKKYCSGIARTLVFKALGRE